MKLKTRVRVSHTESPRLPCVPWTKSRVTYAFDKLDSLVLKVGQESFMQKKVEMYYLLASGM